MRTVVERVALGVAGLDRTDPDWVYEVDLETLGMSDSAVCVAGQQPGGFLATMARLGLGVKSATAWNGYSLDYDGMEEHGFAEASRPYTELQAEWRRVIIERRAADAAAAGE